MKSDSERTFEHQRRLLLLETLYDAAVALPRAESEEALAQAVLERAVSVLDASRGAFVTLSEEGGVAGGSFVGFPRRPPAAAILAEPLLAELEASAAPVSSGRRELWKIPVRDALGTAVSFSGRVAGYLVLADKESRRAPAQFTSEDARFLSSLATLAAVALSKHRELSRLERERERLAEENRRLRDESGRSLGGRRLIGESAAMRRVADLVARAAASSASVLITGESGTGKEMVARLLHEKSSRREAPFVAINCAAVPETLLEAELFGIEKGVATGVDAREGRFELARGGTVLLDEIGDMPPALQSKLLRVLQEREFERVGGRKRIAFSARVLSATHQDLAALVARKAFREDLYYRLRVIEIRLPPLRERREDLPRLIRYFLDRIAARDGTRVPGVERSAMAALLSHEYRGNIRELENVLEGAAALAQGGVIRRGDLQWIEASRAVSEEAEPGAEGAGLTLRALERRHVQRVLRQVQGNKSRAARILGINRRTLYRMKV